MIPHNDLLQWVKKYLGAEIDSVMPIPGDASFRAYYRVMHNNQNFIAAHSPPETENNVGFIAVAKAFSDVGVRVPKIIAQDLDKGWFLLEDFGAVLFADQLFSHKHEVEPLYLSALSPLARIQTVDLNRYGHFEQFDTAHMRRELNFFREWVVEGYLGLPWPVWADETMDRLAEICGSQPVVCIHRDYHGHNLMMLSNDIGVIDFQDALWGPVTYDLVSLVCDRDYHIVPPSRKIQLSVATQFFNALTNTNALTWSSELANYHFDCMAMQRRLKASFIFARKWLRDQYPRYLSYLPRALGHVHAVSGYYPEWSKLHKWFGETVLPRLQEV